MIAVRRILCATDFSPASTPAWEFAQRLAWATKADLLVLHVVAPVMTPLDGGFDAHLYEELVAEGRAEAATGCDRLEEEAASHGLRVAVRVVEGAAAPRIVGVADTEEADVVVLGTHGRTGWNRLLMGSVAERVVQLATQPVITVRAPADIAPVDRPVARVMFPTDFSDASHGAWPWARVLAGLTGAEVDLVHVLLEVVPDRHLDPTFLAGIEAAIRADAEKSVEPFLATAGFPRERIHVHLTHGVETDQIVHGARDRQADLIVMGAHGRSGVFRVALGSVTRRVLHAAPCPVLTVGPRVSGAG